MRELLLGRAEGKKEKRLKATSEEKTEREKSGARWSKLTLEKRKKKPERACSRSLFRCARERKQRHALWRLAAPRRGRRDSITNIISFDDDNNSSVVGRASRPGVDELFAVNFNDSDSDAALAEHAVALRRVSLPFVAVAHCQSFRELFQSRLVESIDSRRRWLLLGGRELDSVFLFEFGDIGVDD